MSRFDRVLVAGAGAFGTALALVAYRAGLDVTLWARDPRQADAIRAAGENARYLPGAAIPTGIAVSGAPDVFAAARTLLTAG